ncbi:uncharacterized protein N7483_007184 [Penicillium malachiteum]|uniref:uncharacterized protein n=1 Tax=Penicillium malachiteum TaxID=1324776 RepID=UPI002546DC05|nr:uncharacterized protein N7483_007184 [Penicillium malachiteum]KAJ5725827.1 hypothetical protein N7483_007184 [Penicillium malachiteum]
MPFFSRVFRSKDSAATKNKAKTAVAVDTTPQSPNGLMPGNALDTPFLLLPFRPSSDPSAARTFIRNYFNQSFDQGAPVSGDGLMQELRLNEPMVLCSVMKWCWSRLPGGVVTWEAYDMFKVGEQDSDLARDAFSTFIPISVDSDARTKIIFDFFDLLAAIAAHGKSNGLGGRKLSRYAGWWAFEHHDTGNGFEASYKNWAAAADATSHLFFAYLRSLSPEVSRGVSGISSLPISLQTLVEATEYPPETPTLLQVTTTKVVMIVDTVSPTPFSLLRRAKNFEYRDDHWHLQEFASYEDPIKALTDECLRVLKCISSTNESSVSSSKQSTSLRDASWSRFEDIGFGGPIDSDPEDEERRTLTIGRSNTATSIKTAPQSQTGDLGRPTTPSWADFMSSGFSDESSMKSPVGLLLPPDKVLPPIAATRGMSSQSHKRSLDTEPALEPAELASINSLDLDDSFWWVWITSLSGDEPSTRKAVFGRCALLETVIRDTKWLVLEEQIKGAAPEPDAGAEIVEKKRFFSFGSRMGTTKLNRRKSSARKVSSSVEDSYKRPNNPGSQSKTSIGPDQHKRIQAAAAALQKRQREQEAEASQTGGKSRSDAYSTKTNSVMTLQPGIVNEASSAMKWASNYDKNEFRAAYLSNHRAGTGAVSEGAADGPEEPESEPVAETNSQTPAAPLPPTTTKGAPPPPPKDTAAVATPLPPSPEPVKKTLAILESEDKNGKIKDADTVVMAEPIESEGQTAEESKKPKKKAGNTGGFKSMFGAGKKKVEAPAPVKTSPSKEPSSSSAVAAARAALEAKAKAAHEIPPKETAPKAVLKKKPPVKPSTPQQQEEDQEHIKYHKKTTVVGSGSPPQTRRGVEYDALSRVGTHERDAADQEFSKFDQGPLVEQPAFVPEEDAPVTPITPTEPELLRTPTNGHEEKVEAVSPVQISGDRWAQIRENAARRTAVVQEEPETRTSQSERTDEGDTSGEETIESRVARIKARVAELTGNMEA